jgi:hypothetical protein
MTRVGTQKAMKIDKRVVGLTENNLRSDSDEMNPAIAR